MESPDSEGRERQEEGPAGRSCDSSSLGLLVGHHKSNRSRDPAVRGAGGAGCKDGRDVIVRMTFMTGRVEKTVQTRSPGSHEGLSGRVE